MREYLLGSQGLGLETGQVLDLFDVDAPGSEIDARIAAFLVHHYGGPKRQAQGISDLIVYYVGHGGFTGPAHDYYLATRYTRQGGEASGSLRMEDLARTLRRDAPTARRYLILDACFAGAAYKYFQGSGTDAILRMTVSKTAELLPLEEESLGPDLPRAGTALLCAASAQDAASADGDTLTKFSQALVEVLTKGHPGGPPNLSLRRVGQLVQATLHSRYVDAARPQVASPDDRQGDVLDVPLFPNIALRVTTSQRIDQLERCVSAIADRATALDKRVDALASQLGRVADPQLLLAAVEARIEALAARDVGNLRQVDSHWNHFGLKDEEWAKVPAEVRTNLFQWRRVRRSGLFWVSAASFLLMIALPMAFMPAISTGVFQVALVLSLLVTVPSIMVLPTVLRSSGYKVAGPESAEWQGFPPIAEMDMSRMAHPLGVAVLRPWFELGVLLFALATTSFGLRAFFPAWFPHFVGQATFAKPGELTDFEVDFTPTMMAQIRWKPAEKVGFDSIERSGIDLPSVRQAIGRVCAAISGDSEDCNCEPAVTGLGAMYRLSHRPVLSAHTGKIRFSRVGLYYSPAIESARVELEPADDNRDAGVPPPTGASISWAETKTGLETLLLALYRARVTVRFGDVTGRGRTSDGAWTYDLPVKVIDIWGRTSTKQDPRAVPLQGSEPPTTIDNATSQNPRKTTFQ